jgi:hypothetical protein
MGDGTVVVASPEKMCLSVVSQPELTILKKIDHNDSND